MLRTFDLALKGAANKSAQGIALGGVGIAEGVTRRPRGAGRGSRWARVALGAGLPTTAVKIFGRCNILEKPRFPPNYQGFSWPAQENVFLRN
jgi:hypothetical protein